MPSWPPSAPSSATPSRRLAHRVDVPAQVKAKKDDTVAKLHDAKVEATRRVHARARRR